MYKFLEPDGKAGTFIKRSLTPSEYLVGWDGKLHTPICPPKERLQNEIAAILYIRKHFPSIPVPNIRCSFEDHGRLYSIMDIIPGIPLIELADEKQAPAIQELEGYLALLHSHRSKTLRGFGGRVFVPARLMLSLPKDEPMEFVEVSSDTEDFVLCHNDLNQANIMVDPVTLRITGIIDWEFAGFFPPEFEYPFYTRKGPSLPLENEPHDEMDLANALVDLGALQWL
jgi:serine/threonine protein kinase